MNLHISLGKRPSLKIGMGDWSALIEAGRLPKRRDIRAEIPPKVA